MGTFRFARRRLPAIKASFSLNGIIFNPFSFSTIILVFAASSPILAPAYLINSVKTIEGGATSCFWISFSIKLSTFATRASVGGNSKVSKRVYQQCLSTPVSPAFVEFTDDFYVFLFSNCLARFQSERGFQSNFAFFFNL
jgi:hypothetical protein